MQRACSISHCASWKHQKGTAIASGFCSIRLMGKNDTIRCSFKARHYCLSYCTELLKCAKDRVREKGSGERLSGGAEMGEHKG